MRWKGRKKSSNVDDRRYQSQSRSSRGRMPIRIPRGRRGQVGGGLGVAGVVIALAVYFLGGDPSMVTGGSSSNSGSYRSDHSTQPAQRRDAKEDELADFVSVVLQDTEDAWNKVFRDQLGKNYREPRMVLYRGEVNSACGFASAATGPFYCPGDQKLYIDLSFYDDLKRKFGAPGDFAMAYVVAHEVGHHVQYLLGTLDYMRNQRRRLSKTEYNKLSVKQELQADFYAGLWAHHAQKMKNILENGDLDEALRAANAIGDDNLQKRSRGYVVPESFTHGTSAQRKRWFKKGYNSGKVREGDTFNAPRL